MPDLPNLPLRRIEYEALRKKKRGFGGIPPRDYNQHAESLRAQVEEALLQPVRHPPPRGIDPALILRVKVAGNIDEETWRRLNLTLLGQDDERTLVLFSNDAELLQFHSQLAAYQGGAPQGQKNAPYAGIFSNIEEVGTIQPADRIGRLLKESGITSLEQFDDGAIHTLDLDLWHTGNTQECQTRLDQIRTYVAAQGGRITDSYIGPSLVLARIVVSGQILRRLFEIDAVACIDLPPRVSLRVGQQINTGLQDLGLIPQPPDGAPGVCTLDSGVTSAHPLLGPAIGEATAVPAQLGDPADGHGHGTMVAGLALYGDVQQCIERRSFVPMLRLFSARVLNANNEFDNERLITTQMKQAIEYFRNTYGCRVFNASLGDRRLPFNGGKVSAWAAILDHLARELDVVLVVSAGNYDHEPPGAGDHDHHVNGYPRYLLDPPAKIIEPATGSIVLTVGAIANSANVPLAAAGAVQFRPIAQTGQPSPFTRSGPGIGGAIKPELCEYGGNSAFNGLLRRTETPIEMSILSLNREYLARLFHADAGTSFAAPRVSHNAARLFGQYPRATANLIRALLASSAVVPQAARDLLDPIGTDAIRMLCGYGVASSEKASKSDTNRVVLHAENSLPFDRFHIYEVPIPDEFYEGRGDRRISVSLSFDPPVRHSRLDYLGTTMSFRLIRGKNVEDIAAAFRKPAQEDPRIERIGSPYDCPMAPKPTQREGGTLQKAIFTIKRVAENYGDTYYIVVRCQREWAQDEHYPQRYAIVVTIEHDEQVDLYARLQARLQAPIRLRARR